MNDGAEGAGAPTRRAVARAVSWVALGHAVSQGLWLGSLLLLAALLDPRDFGTLASALVLVNLAGLLVDSGTRGSLIAKPTLTRADVRGAILLNAGIGVLLTTAIALAAGPAVSAFAAGGDVAAVRALSTGVLLYALGITAFALLQKRLRLKEYAAASIASSVAASVVAVVAALLGAGVWALVARQLLSMGLLSAFAWIAARRLLPAREATGGPRLRLRQPGWLGFLALAAADFAVLNSDVFVVGSLTEATGLGLYALAFTLAFAPLTQVAWQVGRVLFPAAAATEHMHDVARRTLVSLRLMALLLAPVLPPVVALAPVLPELLGERWAPVVIPFQLLAVAGVGHALFSVIGESLSGTGNVGLRARIHVAWAVAMIAALLIAVPRDGIRGAALAHVVLLVPFAAAFVFVGAPRLGLGARRIAAALAPVAVAVGAQAVATAGVVLALGAAGAVELVAGAGGALAGLVVVAVLLRALPSSPLREGRAVLAEALGRVS